MSKKQLWGWVVVECLELLMDLGMDTFVPVTLVTF